MTRKRFVKLLMEKGFSRNEATLEAHFVKETGKSYQQHYDWLVMCETFAEMRDRIAGAFSSVCDAAKRVVTALAAGVEAFAEAYNRGLSEAEEKSRQ